VQVSSGPALMTPIPQWFFEVHQAAPHHWNQTFAFEIPQWLSPEAAQVATEHLVKRHDALRLAFHKKEGRWTAEVKLPEAIHSFQKINLFDCEPDMQTTEISKRLSEIQTTLNLEKGSLFQCIYIDSGSGQNNRLILLAHHLVVDAVSWGLLIEELALLVHSVSHSQEISMTATTTPYTVWCNYLSDYAKSDDVAKEMAFWQAQTQSLDRLPADFKVSFPIVESSVSISTHELAKEQTQRLQDSLKAYNMRTDEMLVTALMLALGKWASVSELCLGFERHGRGLIDNELDFSGTIGWFTTYFPILLTIDTSMELGAILKSVKEQLRQTPKGGLGYGVLRYLGRQKELTQRPIVLFNYIRSGQGLESPVLGKGEFIDKDIRDPQSERYYQLEINALLRNGVLQTTWSYCRDQYRSSSIEDLIANYHVSLQELISHCTETGSGGYTPSDFPEADLSQNDLDRLFDQLDL
ncbi:MAG: condensation domain-containing protein, partial [Cyclobacteriaceae bacterium]